MRRNVPEGVHLEQSIGIRGLPVNAQYQHAQVFLVEGIEYALEPVDQLHGRRTRLVVLEYLQVQILQTPITESLVGEDDAQVGDVRHGNGQQLLHEDGRLELSDLILRKRFSPRPGRQRHRTC